MCVGRSVVRSCMLVSGNSNCNEEAEAEAEELAEELAESEGGRGAGV